MLPPGAATWSPIVAVLGGVVVCLWLVFGPQPRRLAVLWPLAALTSLLAFAIGLLGAAQAASPSTVGAVVAVVTGCSLAPVFVATAGLLFHRLSMAPPRPPAEPPPGRGAPPPTASPAPPATSRRERDGDQPWREAVETLAALQREQTARLAAALEPLGPGLTAAAGASSQLELAISALRAQQDQLVALLTGWQAHQEPVLSVLDTAGEQLAAVAGDMAQAVRMVVANQELAVASLEAMRDDLNAAGQSLSDAAEKWELLINTGLADTREFSRQAVEELLSHLQRSPEQLTGLPEATREAIDQAEATQQQLTAATTELGVLADRLQERFDALAAQLGAELQGALEAVDTTSLSQLQESIASLRTSTSTVAEGLARLAPAFGNLAQLSQLTTSLDGLRAALESRVARQGWGWPARLLAAAVLLYVLATLGMSAGLFGR